MKIFIISLPRSGSTLLQRLLSQHTGIHTRSESWLMPLIGGGLNSTLRIVDVCGVDNIRYAINSIEKGRFDRALVREAFRGFYKSDSFIEKTPRNYFYLDKIKESFPDAYYIYLTRNKFDQIQSCFKTFKKDRNRFETFYNDWRIGSAVLSSRIDCLGDNELHINYEDLIASPLEVCNEMLDFLGLPEMNELSNKVDVISGGFGDPNQRAEDVSSDKKYLRISFVRLFVIKFCERLYVEDFTYSERRNHYEISLNVTLCLRDMYHMLVSCLYVVLRLRAIKKIISSEFFVW